MESVGQRPRLRACHSLAWGLDPALGSGRRASEALGLPESRKSRPNF
ncbi:MAG: hypothetical protein MUE85_03225 [Microscillaceae bacterium]|nr:hypothetical protein [Microscillaceae bacterium]